MKKRFLSLLSGLLLTPLVLAGSFLVPFTAQTPAFAVSTNVCNDADTVFQPHSNGTDASTSFPDASASANTITARGNGQVDTAQSVYGGASLLTDGTGDDIDAPDSSNWDLGTGDATIELRVRFNTVPTVLGIFIAHADAVAGQATGQWMFQFCPAATCGSNLLRFLIDIDAVSRNILTAAWTPSANTWYALRWVRTGTTTRFFVDGTQVGTDGTATETLTTSATPVLSVGATNNQLFSIDGWIDEPRIVTSAVNTGNYTPAAAEYVTCSTAKRLPLLGAG